MKKTMVMIALIFLLVCAYICDAQISGSGNPSEKQYIVTDIVDKTKDNSNDYVPKYKSDKDFDGISEEDIGDKPDTGDTPDTENEAEEEKE
jgi:hypothetical protein